MLIGTTVLLVTAAVDGLILFGRLDSAYGIAIPAAACLAGLLGALVPRIVLTWLFASAPLLWAFGDANVIQGRGAHVNLPMLVGFVLIIAFSPQLLIKDCDAGVEKIRKLVLVFTVVCIPAIFSAQDLFTGGGVYLRIICPFIIMFAAYRYAQSRQDVLSYARNMAFALVAVVIVLVIAYQRSELWVDFGGYTRLSALHLPTQDFATFLTVMVFVVLLNYLLTRNLAYLLPLPFVLIGLYLTYFRTAWISAALLMVLFAFEVKKSYGRRLLLAGLIAGAIYFPMVSGSLLRYDTEVDSPYAADNVLSGRLVVDAVAVESYLDAPFYNKIFGIGFYRTKEATRLALGDEFSIHDDYLAFLIEAGMFALALYLAILVVLLKRSRQGKRRARERITYDTCGAASLLVVTVMIMGIPGAFYTEVLSNLYIYGIMGLMLAVSRFLNSRNQNNEGAGTVLAHA
jgi:hypothetical protein